MNRGTATCLTLRGLCYRAAEWAIDRIWAWWATSTNRVSLPVFAMATWRGSGVTQMPVVVPALDVHALESLRVLKVAAALEVGAGPGPGPQAV